MHAQLIISKLFALTVSGLLLALTAPASSQEYPTRTVKIVVPLTAGGGADLVGRMLASLLQPRLKQAVIVENRPGAGGYIGSDQVLRSEPDGHTLLLTSSSLLYPDLFTQGAAVLSSELTPIAPVAQLPYILTVPASLPVRSLKAFVGHAKANPAKLNAGIVTGTSALDTIRFQKLAGIEMQNIPYGGASEIITAMVRGDVHLYITSKTSAGAMLDAGKLLVLAVGSKERARFMPDVPTLKESGYDLEVTTWFGLFGPNRMPAEIVSRLHRDIAAAMESTEALEFLKKSSLESLRATPVQMRGMISREYEQYTAASKSLKR